MPRFVRAAVRNEPEQTDTTFDTERKKPYISPQIVLTRFCAVNHRESSTVNTIPTGIATAAKTRRNKTLNIFFRKPAIIFHVLLIPNGGIAWDDMPERERVISLNVCGKGIPLVVAEFRKARDQPLENCSGVNVDEVIRIHLQSVLYAVGVDYDTEHGRSRFAFRLNEYGPRDVVKLSRYLVRSSFACLRGGWKYDDISVHQ